MLAAHRCSPIARSEERWLAGPPAGYSEPLKRYALRPLTHRPVKLFVVVQVKPPGVRNFAEQHSESARPRSVRAALQVMFRAEVIVKFAVCASQSLTDAAAPCDPTQNQVTVRVSASSRRVELDMSTIISWASRFRMVVLVIYDHAVTAAGMRGRSRLAS